MELHNRNYRRDVHAINGVCNKTYPALRSLLRWPLIQFLYSGDFNEGSERKLRSGKKSVIMIPTVTVYFHENLAIKIAFEISLIIVESREPKNIFVINTESYKI